MDAILDNFISATNNTLLWGKGNSNPFGYGNLYEISVSGLLVVLLTGTGGERLCILDQRYEEISEIDRAFELFFGSGSVNHISVFIVEIMHGTPFMCVTINNQAYDGCYYIQEMWSGLVGADYGYFIPFE